MQQAPHSAMPPPNFVPSTSRNTQMSAAPSSSTFRSMPLTSAVVAMPAARLSALRVTEPSDRQQVGDAGCCSAGPGQHSTVGRTTPMPEEAHVISAVPFASVLVISALVCVSEPASVSSSRSADTPLDQPS
jgi:hypothetical protein